MKSISSIFRQPRSVALLALLAVAGLLAACGNDYSDYTSTGNSSSSASFYYGVGVYDSWGYYGNPYYGGGGGTVIVTPPRPPMQRPVTLPANVARPRMR
jgi:hypothetical protein